jgi:hypothetical protein
MMGAGNRIPGIVMVALIALAGAAVIAIAALVQAVLLQPMPAADTVPASSPVPPFEAVRSDSPAIAVAAAASNPFHPKRRADRDRFRMPGESADTAMAKRQANADDAVRLMGTGLVPGGRDFVVCQASGDEARLVRVGEKCGGLLLIRVAPTTARFQAADGSPVVLNVPKAGT